MLFRSGSRAAVVSVSMVMLVPSGTMTRTSGSEAGVLSASMVGLAPSGDMMVLAMVALRYRVAVYACTNEK